MTHTTDLDNAIAAINGALLEIGPAMAYATEHGLPTDSPVHIKLEIIEGSLGSALPGLIALRDGAGWRPIDTAPKDGTPIAFRSERCQLGACQWWSPERQADAADWDAAPEDFDGCWLFDGDDDGDEIFPTHWMPLPAPPASHGEG
jgi:hypothetical protein